MKNKILVIVMVLWVMYTAKSIDTVAIVIVIDQLSYEALHQVTPYLTGGLKELLSKGTIYTDAHYPYARTSTGPGHATLNTGALPKEHGIVSNYWYDTQGKKIPCDYDTTENAAILSPTGYYKKSRSAQHAKIDGISDQLIINACNNENKTISISIKSRAAIFTAGRLGKAFFFDPKTGHFTTTKAYHDTIPTWVKEFNTKKKLDALTSMHWKLFHPAQSPAYTMVSDNYSAARLPSFVNKDITYEFLSNDKNKKHNFYNFIAYCPQSNKILLDLAEEYIQTQIITNNGVKKLLLWISLSSLDKIGHMFGPNSIEYIDTIYHIDHYLKHFMNTIKTMIPEEKILYTVTSDHGSTPMVEVLHEKNFSLAQRVLTPRLERKMNKKIKKKYGIDNIVKEVDNPSIFLDNSKLSKLPVSQKKALLFDLKHYLKKQPGIKAVWTHEELEKIPALKGDFTLYYKNQLFPGRTGSLLYQTYPYAYPTCFKQGTGHVSCYDYTTHVPLIFYQFGKTVPKRIDTRISMDQVAPTLAKKLDIPTPSACAQNILSY